MSVNIEDIAIDAVAKLSVKPIQGRPEIIQDDKKDLPQSNELWGEDVLGDYDPQHVRVTLYLKAIAQASRLLHISEEDLRLVVLLHELGHWFWHMALDDVGNNWQNYGSGVSDCREALAQLCVCWASNAECLQSKKGRINKALFDLMKKQSPVYQLPEGHGCLKPWQISAECLRDIKELQSDTPTAGIDSIMACIESRTLMEL
jgi:hypothetical protein